jgi:hypothetical protein
MRPGAGGGVDQSVEQRSVTGKLKGIHRGGMGLIGSRISGDCGLLGDGRDDRERGGKERR